MAILGLHAKDVSLNGGLLLAVYDEQPVALEHVKGLFSLLMPMIAQALAGLEQDHAPVDARPAYQILDAAIPVAIGKLVSFTCCIGGSAFLYLVKVIDHLTRIVRRVYTIDHLIFAMQQTRQEMRQISYHLFPGQIIKGMPLELPF